MAVKVTPGPVSGLVERSRLFDLLDRGAAGPATLVCGPAGSGKTVLVSSWLESRTPPCALARVAVASDETDATRFWGGVTDALRRCGAVAPGDPLATLASAPLGGQDEFLSGLLDGLGRLAKPVLLVLDDLEQLRSADALDSLGRLLAHAPAQLRTLLISRREPKLGLHRLRLSGRTDGAARAGARADGRRGRAAAGLGGCCDRTFLSRAERQWQLRAQLRTGDAGPLRAALEAHDAGPEWGNLAALLHLADGDPAAAAAVIAPTLDGTMPHYLQNLDIEASVLDGIAQLRLGDAAAARRSTERALEISGQQGRVWIYLTVPGARELLEAHPLHATAFLPSRARKEAEPALPVAEPAVAAA